MTVDYRKLNQVETPTTVTLPDVVSVPEQINTFLGTWYAATDLTNAFSLYLLVGPPEAVCFQLARPSAIHLHFPVSGD